jgi:glycine/D-amino acid oxidase-like deaminating enzyme
VAERYDAIVVGAGIVGAACARALALEGMRVLVVDGRFAGGGTTAAGMGHLVVMDDSPEQLALTALSVELWRDLSRKLSHEVEFDPCGTIWVAEDGEQLDAVREKQRVYATHGVASHMLDARGVAEAEPNLRSGLAGGLLVPGDAVVYPPRAALWLLDDACARGATVLEHSDAAVTDVFDHGIRCGSREIEADVVVLAAGAEAASLVPEVPIVPRKGHLAITDRYHGFVRHQLVELGYLTSAHVMTSESVAFNVQPRVTGQVLIGSSRELVGWDASMNRSILRRMLERAAAFMPSLADLSIIRTWTGFRPATPDKLPLIGPWPSIAGVWIAAGHEGLGITTSIATARLIADLVVGRTPPIDASPYAPARVLDAATPVHST